MKYLEKLFFLSIFFFLTSCLKEEKTAKITFTLENSKVEVENFKICETESGFQISVEKSLQKKIATQKIKTFFVTNDKTKIEIKTFNILLSPPENYHHKAPTTPKGRLAFFKDGNNSTIDILSDNKSDIINLVGKNYVIKCASH